MAETEAETAPVEGVAETVALPMGGVCDRDGGTAKRWRDGDGEDAGMMQAKAIGEGEANGGDGDRRRQGQWRRM